MWTLVIMTALNRWAWRLSFMRNGAAWRQAWNSRRGPGFCALDETEPHQSMSKTLIRDSSEPARGPAFQGVLEKWWPLSDRVCGHTSFINAVLQAVIISFKWTHMHMHHLDSSSRILAYINTVCHTPFKISCFSYLWQQLISSRQRMQRVHREVNLSTKYIRAALSPTFFYCISQLTKATFELWHHSVSLHCMKLVWVLFHNQAGKKIWSPRLVCWLVFKRFWILFCWSGLKICCNRMKVHK